MALAYLGLGTNLGSKEANLASAIQALATEVGTILKKSTFYSSKSWGFESANDFLNAVILLKTNLSPFELLTKIQEIERKLGRETKTTTAYSDRIIDIDIVLYDDLVIDLPKLKIPHPLMLERDFVIIPLLEIAPELVHPVFGEKISVLVEK